MPAIVEGDPYGFLSSRIQQSGLHWIGSHYVDGRVIGKTAADRDPGFSSIMSAKSIGMQIVYSKAIHGNIGGIVVEARCVDLRNFAPGCDSRRRDVLPVRAAVARNPHQAVIGPGPDSLCCFIGGRNGIDHAAAFILL